MSAQTPQTPPQSASPMVQPRTTRKRKYDDNSACFPHIHGSPSTSKKPKQSKSQNQKAMRDAQADLERTYYRDYEPLYERLQALGCLTLPEKVKSPTQREYRRYEGPWRASFLNKIHAAIAELNRIPLPYGQAFNNRNAAAAAVPAPAIGGNAMFNSVNHSFNAFNATNNVNPFHLSDFHLPAHVPYASPWQAAANPFSMALMGTPAPDWFPASGSSAASTHYPTSTVETGMSFNVTAGDMPSASAKGIGPLDLSPVETPASAFARTFHVPAAHHGSPGQDGHQSQPNIEADDLFQQLWHPQPRQAPTTIDRTGSDGGDLNASLATTATVSDMPGLPPPQCPQEPAVAKMAPQEPVSSSQTSSTSSSSEGPLTPAPAPAAGQGPSQEASAAEAPTEVAIADWQPAETGLDMFDLGLPVWEDGMDDSCRKFWEELLAG